MRARENKGEGFRKRRDGESEIAFNKAYDLHCWKLEQKRRKRLGDKVAKTYKVNTSPGKVKVFNKKEIAAYEAELNRRDRKETMKLRLERA